jgi:hypothetical protein
VALRERPGGGGQLGEVERQQASSEPLGGGQLGGQSVQETGGGRLGGVAVQEAGSGWAVEVAPGCSMPAAVASG